MTTIIRLIAALASIGVTFAIVLGVVSVADYERASAVASVTPAPVQVAAAGGSRNIK